MLSIKQALAYPKGGLVLARHYDAANDWYALEDRSLVPSDITYEPKINSRTVQGEKTRARAQQDGGTVKVGATIFG